MLLALLYNSQRGIISLAIPEGLDKATFLKWCKDGLNDHISGLHRNGKGDDGLDDLQDQIKRNLFNLEDWTISENQDWEYEGGFVHSLAQKTWKMDPSGWFHYRLDQFHEFRTIFEQEPRPYHHSREAWDPHEFSLYNWIINERSSWKKKIPGYQSAVDWKWSAMTAKDIASSPSHRDGILTDSRGIRYELLNELRDKRFTDQFMQLYNAINASNHPALYYQKQTWTRESKRARDRQFKRIPVSN